MPIEIGDLTGLAPAIGRIPRVRTVTGTYDARVARVSAAVAPKTRLATAFLKFGDDTAGKPPPVPGTFAQVRIFGSKRDGVYVLPEPAARERDSIWVVKDGALRSLTPKTVGRTAAGWIVEAFDAGDGVVVSALSGAREGLEGRPGAVVAIDRTRDRGRRMPDARHSGGQSLLGIADGVNGWLAKYESPTGVEVAIWRDRVAPIFDRFCDIIRNAVIGIVLVFVCLVLVFDLRVATWIAVGIPLSVIASLLFFDVSNLTLNMGTMFAFFLLIGIVVVVAVVVGESIAAERERGKGALDAAISGARAVVGPITVGVLTTVLAFVPFLFVTAGNYQIVQVFPFVAFFVLFISLAEAFFILPAHLSHEGRWSLSPLREIQERVRGWVDELRDPAVVPVVSWSVRHVFLTFFFGLVFRHRLRLARPVRNRSRDRFRPYRQCRRHDPGGSGTAGLSALRRQPRRRAAFRPGGARDRRTARGNVDRADRSHGRQFGRHRRIANR